MGLNECVFVGRLTRDPELKTTSSGIEVCNFNIAVDRRFKPKDGGQDVDFIDCTAWRQTAVFVDKYFAKGKMIAVHGALCVENYEDKDGNKRKKAYISVDNVSFCGGKNDEGTAERQTAPSAPPQNMPSAASLNVPFDDDDELPF